MQIPFTKMHGAGNDFVVLDNRSKQLPLDSRFISRISDRHFGVGADQVLIVENPDYATHDFKYRIFNADGQEVQQCGNGARCFAQYVFEKGLTPKTTLKVETRAGVIAPQLKGPNLVRVDMGPAAFAPTSLPFQSEGLPTRQVGGLTQYQLQVDSGVSGEKLWVSVASMGNPHVVIQCDQPASDELVDRLGPVLESHPRFPERVNVGFMSVVDRNRAQLRVYERGVGETLACGTGACAAAVCGMKLGLLANRVEMVKRGGVLVIEWAGESEDHVYMTGPAETVFEGVYVYELGRN